MELRQLEAFTAVLSTGSFTGAARLLNRSQPAMTRLVQELESEVGYALFTRNGPRVAPTTQGFLLYEDAERVLSGMRLLERRSKDIARSDTQAIVLAATSALAVGLVPAALRALEAQHGAAPVQLRSASPEQVLEAVLSGAVQLGACSLPLEHRGLHVHWIGQLPCLAALPQDDPLAALERVPLAALAQRRLVTMSNPFRLRHRLDAHFSAQADHADRARPALIETNSSVNALALVRAGLGVAVLEPLTCHGNPLHGVVLRPLDVDIPFFFGVVTPQARPINALLQALIDGLLAAARALPDFVQHDVSTHATLLQNELPPQKPLP